MKHKGEKIIKPFQPLDMFLDLFSGIRASTHLNQIRVTFLTVNSCEFVESCSGSHAVCM